MQILQMRYILLFLLVATDTNAAADNVAVAALDPPADADTEASVLKNTACSRYSCDQHTSAHDNTAAPDATPPM